MPWQSFFGITVQHSFFSATSGPVLHFVPHPQTERIIKNANLLSRNTINRLILCYNHEQKAILDCFIPENDSTLDFSFDVYSSDPHYSTYTEPYVFPSNTLPFFSNRGNYVPVKEGVQLKPEAVSARKQKNYSIIQPPLFKITISLAKKDNLDDHKEYIICHVARQTYWKYYFLGELAKKEAMVNDMHGKMQFRYAGKQTPFPDTPARVYYSTEPIILRDRPDQRFQLRQLGEAGDKVLIKRLPNASAKNLSREIIQDKEVYVSEIFINY